MKSSSMMPRSMLLPPPVTQNLNAPCLKPSTEPGHPEVGRLSVGNLCRVTRLFNCRPVAKEFGASPTLLTHVQPAHGVRPEHLFLGIPSDGYNPMNNGLEVFLQDELRVPGTARASISTFCQKGSRRNLAANSEA